MVHTARLAENHQSRSPRPIPFMKGIHLPHGAITPFASASSPPTGPSQSHLPPSTMAVTGSALAQHPNLIGASRAVVAPETGSAPRRASARQTVYLPGGPHTYTKQTNHP